MHTHLHSRLFFIIIAPLLLGTFCYSLYFAHSRNQEINDSARSRHEILAERLRISMLLNEHQLQKIPLMLDSAMDSDEVRSIRIYNSTGICIYQRGQHSVAPRFTTSQINMLPEHQETDETDSWFLAIESRTTTSNEPAWLEMDFSSLPIQLEHYKNYLSILLLDLLFAGLSLIWVMHQMHFLLRPFRQLQDNASLVRGGHFETRFNYSDLIEYNELSSSLNQMLELIQTEVEDLQQTMNRTHEDLQSTMESMEIQNIELSLARKEALEGARIKSEFLANISHEIRSPLNSIIGFIQLLSRSPLPERQMEYIRTIQKSSNSLLAMLNDVLDLSKIEARKLILDKSPFNLEDCVYDVISMLAPQADAKALNLLCLIYDDVSLHWNGDGLRLKQILTNLIANAIKFTDKGDITVRVMLESVKPQVPVLRFTVQDTGIGLDQKIKEDLFCAFTQADASTSRKYGGTGLGLVISKYLVEQMGGEIGFESTVGEGSLFWFTARLEEDEYVYDQKPYSIVQHIGLMVQHEGLALMWQNQLRPWAAQISQLSSLDSVEQCTPPIDLLFVHLSTNYPMGTGCPEPLLTAHIPTILMQNSVEHRADSWVLLNPALHILTIPMAPSFIVQYVQQLFNLVPVKAPLPISPVFAAQVRILVVDDQPANLKLMAIILEDMGFQPLIAPNGLAVLKILEQQSVDIIFMDIQMPGMDGLETTRQIRTRFASRKIHIIALTAHALDDDRQQYIQAGMNDCITKPLQESKLLAILHKWGNSGTTLVTGNNTDELVPLVDLEEGVRQTNGRLDMAKSMIDMLIQHIPIDMEIIRKAITEQNREALLDRVHYVHSASHYCGVPRLRQYANRLELSIKQMGKNPYVSWNTLTEQTNLFVQTMQELIEWHKEQAFDNQSTEIPVANTPALVTTGLISNLDPI